jgi:hypothetical protein
MTFAQDKFLAERVRNATRNAVGFPNPINKQFRDISPVVEGDPTLFRAVVEAMAGICKETAPDCVMCVESWGIHFRSTGRIPSRLPDVFGAPTWEAPRRRIR